VEEAAHQDLGSESTLGGRRQGLRMEALLWVSLFPMAPTGGEGGYIQREPWEYEKAIAWDTGMLEAAIRVSWRGHGVVEGF
jgi:hypothetical protein